MFTINMKSNNVRFKINFNDTANWQRTKTNYINTNSSKLNNVNTGLTKISKIKNKEEILALYKKKYFWLMKQKSLLYNNNLKNSKKNEQPDTNNIKIVIVENNSTEQNNFKIYNTEECETIVNSELNQDKWTNNNWEEEEEVFLHSNLVHEEDTNLEW